MKKFILNLVLAAALLLAGSLPEATLVARAQEVVSEVENYPVLNPTEETISGDGVICVQRTWDDQLPPSESKFSSWGASLFPPQSGQSSMAQTTTVTDTTKVVGSVRFEAPSTAPEGAGEVSFVNISVHVAGKDDDPAGQRNYSLWTPFPGSGSDARWFTGNTGENTGQWRKVEGGARRDVYGLDVHVMGGRSASASSADTVLLDLVKIIRCWEKTVELTPTPTATPTATPVPPTATPTPTPTPTPCPSLPVVPAPTPLPTVAPGQVVTATVGAVCRHEVRIPQIRTMGIPGQCPAWSQSAAEAAEAASVVATLGALPSCSPVDPALWSAIIARCSGATSDWQVSNGREVTAQSFSCQTAAAAETAEWAVLSFRAAVAAAAIAALPVGVTVVAVVVTAGIVYVVVNYDGEVPSPAYTIHDNSWLAREWIQGQLQNPTGIWPFTPGKVIRDEFSVTKYEHYEPERWLNDDPLVEVVQAQTRPYANGHERVLLQIEDDEKIVHSYLLVEGGLGSNGGTLALPGVWEPYEVMSELIMARGHNKPVDSFPVGGAVGAPTSVPKGQPLPPPHLSDPTYQDAADRTPWKLLVWNELTTALNGGGKCGQGGPCCEDVSVGAKLYRLITYAVTRYDSAGNLLYKSVYAAAYIGTMKKVNTTAFWSKHPLEANGAPSKHQTPSYFQHSKGNWGNCPPPGSGWLPTDSPGLVP